ncbi:MAG: hypothetical protein PHI72_04750 [Atribacterota bacterium]|jgi:hypothetical protein|nr:hypothetical protein [Atribacterota bacterium]MDD5638001.1 hypothetical protein [Atribacterota bacterium]
MKKINKWIWIFLLFLLVTQFIFSVTLIASEKDLIAEALYYLEQQNYKMAADILEKTLTLIWNKAPLELNNLCFTKEEATGFGFYLRRDDNHFKPGEDFFIYSEPKNYTIKEIDEGLYEIYFKEDLYFLDMEGNILGEQKDFLEYHIISHAPNKELFINNVITQNEPFPPGDYQFLLIVKDVASQKTVEKTINFVID